jgi:DegV family protein with EDD domain
VITISGKLSGTYQSASIAKENYEDSIFLVDSENVCIGTQILVRFAMELREKGLDAKTIVSELEKKKKDVCVIALLDTLEYLKRGGRISKTSAFAGEMLSLKPVIAVVDGEVVSLGNARGSKKGNNMLTQLISEKGGIDFKKPYALGYAGLSDALLQKYIEDSASIWKEQTDKLPISTIGSTIGTHVGPGAIAVDFFHL